MLFSKMFVRPGVVLNLKFRPLILHVVVVERIVHDDDVVAAAHATRVASDGNAHGIGVVEEIVADGDVAAVVALVLAGRFHVQVAIVDRVAFEDRVWRNRRSRVRPRHIGFRRPDCRYEVML